MSLQLIPILYFVSLLLLPRASSSGPDAKPGCQDRCGNLSIPYPFGVGSGCFLNPSFQISCDTSSTDPPKAHITIIDKEVIEINQTYIRVKYPNPISACYHGETGTKVNSSTIVDLSGTGYTLSYWNSLIAIGCDDMVLQSNGSSISGVCSAFCADNNDKSGLGYCPSNASSLSNGCCQTFISQGTSFLEAELIDLSRKVARKRLFPCSYAFIQELGNVYTNFSYPLYYLDNATALLNDKWLSSSRPPVVRLDWRIGVGNCSLAKRNYHIYACRSDKSVCVDDVYIDDTDNLGYRCSCVQGYEGNPYLEGGCKVSFFSSTIAKAGCQDLCGNVSIPYPFGVGQKHCYLESSFEIICNTSTNPPKAYLAALNKEILTLNLSQVLINYPNQVALACYNFSEGITKTEDRNFTIDLSKTQYTLSQENRITAIGCDDKVVGIIGQANQSFISSCAAFCSDEYDDYGFCPSRRSRSGFGIGCCRASIPRGTTYVKANLTDISGQWRRRKLFPCSYAYIGYHKHPDYDYYDYPLDYLNNSTAIPADDQNWRETTVLLEWRIGTDNCTEARRDPTTFACGDNSDCFEFDANVGGYLCNCSKGYQGNPYLSLGCQDINECDDGTNNPCGWNSRCTNTEGSFTCSCPKGYSGDGKKDGAGCMPSHSISKTILIGLGSGMGFLLLLVMCFWLYKVLQKRKEKRLKEKFFKRNGGLLLQQQTNEGILGKTRVFPAKELEVATDNFNENRILGHGGQGTVYKGMLSDGKIVAIKKSKLVEENNLEQFINEVAILSQINHRNVVRLLGYCLETEVPLLVYEFMPNGTLYDLIHDLNNEFPFPWSMRLKTAADIAGALAYLHCASSTPIYHKDIKSTNILLDEKYVVKVSDFGTSRSIAADHTHLTTLVKGTFGYLDPEYFQSSQFTEKSDVYSFGVVLVELLTGKRPISFDKTEEERGLATRFLACMDGSCLDTILDPQVLEQGRKEEVILFARLAHRCLNLQGKMRPTMKEVATELESLRMSQMSSGVKDESEDMRTFENMPTTISDTEYT